MKSLLFRRQRCSGVDVINAFNEFELVCDSLSLVSMLVSSHPLNHRDSQITNNLHQLENNLHQVPRLESCAEVRGSAALLMNPTSGSTGGDEA